MALGLRAVLGPYLDVYKVTAEKPAVIGRSATCDVCLAHESVSRRHASVMWGGAQWLLVDEGSSGGTFVNGVKLLTGRPSVVSHGDLIRIGPWTLRADVAGDGSASRGGSVVKTLDDGGDASRRVERVLTRAGGLAAERLRTLTECLSRLQGSKSEGAMAEIALEHAIKGSGYPRGAVLRPGEGGDVVVVAARGMDAARDGVVGAGVFSRSLLAEASRGAAVWLGEGTSAGMGANVSMAEAQVERAVCAPVMLGETVCAYVYLDAARGQGTGSPEAGVFCEAIARAYGMALANVKRAELEERQRELTAELESARGVQQMIAPAEAGSVGHVTYAFHMQPGVFVAGDLFDVIPLAQGVAVCLGDVTGHGAGSGMLMALTQAHLNAHLRASGDLLAAVTSLNAYLADHASGGRFVTLWVGVVEGGGLVTFIDAGHGHAHVRRAVDGGREELVAGRGIPLGIDGEAVYATATVALKAGDRLVIYSDGVVDQVGSVGEPFGMARLDEAMALAAGRGGASGESPEDGVRGVMDALRAFAPAGRLDDDATMALIEYRPQSD